MYPEAKIWIVGIQVPPFCSRAFLMHLGGALASLIGLTFGAPTVAFEALGEAMAARRLHLPFPVSRDGL